MKRLLLVLFAFSVAAAAEAQLNANNARGFEAGKVYQFGDIDHVNVFNGNLIVTLPLQTYRVSEHLSWGLTLVYNGNPWNFRTDGAEAEPIPSRFANAGLGWQLSFGELVGPNDTLSTSLGTAGTWVYAAPDGAERTFHRRLHAEELGTSYEASTSPQPGHVVGYTRDGSYLRLVRIGPRYVRTDIESEPNPNPPPPRLIKSYYIYVAEYRVEFPDGTRHTLTSTEYANEVNEPPAYAYEQSARYRVTKMEDRFGNSVSIDSTDADDPNELAATWTVTERAGATVLRTHTVNLGRDTFQQLNRSAQARRRVDSVSLTAFDGQLVTYAFEYSGNTSISSPCLTLSDTAVTSGNLLKRVSATRTAGGTTTTLLEYSMEYYDKVLDDSGELTCSDYAGHLQSITLPAGGKIEYTARRRAFPTEKTGSGPGSGPGAHPNVSTAVDERRMIHTDGTAEVTAYKSHLHRPAAYVDEDGNHRTIPTQMTVAVTDPGGHVTHSHFSVAKVGNPDSCLPGGANSREYGLPFLRIAGTAETDLLLSSEIFGATCKTFAINGCKPGCQNADGAFVNPLRRNYVKYELDTHDLVGLPVPGHNQRMVASRTEFVDSFCSGSARCYTQARMSDFDGLGHYRTETRSSNFAGTTNRTAETSFNANANRGTYTPGAGASPTSYMIATGDPWLLNLHDQVKTSEGTAASVEQLCFDRTIGFLQRRRVLSSTASTPATSTKDLLTVLTNSSGNVTAEAFYGGDVVPLTAMADGCADTPGVASYEIAHSYEAGVRKSSEFLLTENSRLAALDLTVDSNTGLPSASRDTASVTTTYKYDVLGRLEESRPTGEAWTRYRYDLTSRPASVIIETFASGVTAVDETTPRLAERRLYYDGVGRLVQTRDRMPAEWAVTHTTYDILGRRASVSVPFAAATGAYASTPAGTLTTTFAYDPFGRPTSIVTPDGKTTSFTYEATRVVNRTVDVGGTNALTTETYDGHGRLLSVTEGASDQRVTTSYGYDVGNRLVSVTTSDQTRTFEYDGRGLLLREQHPETGAVGNGVTYYGSLSGATVVPEYDARGQMTRRITETVNGRYDLKFGYDKAGRLTKVEDVDPITLARRTLKSFAYAETNDTAAEPDDLRAGKLVEAVRKNYTPGLGTIEVKEAYLYQSPGGRPTSRQTTVTGSASFSGATFTLNQTWNDLGQLETLTYPSTASVNVPRTITNTYTNGHLTGVAGYAAITYQPNGLINTVTHSPSAVTESWTSDPTGMPRPKRIEVKGSQQNVLWSYGDYAYDGAGNITAIGARSFRYDAMNRLTGWTDTTTTGHTATTRELDAFGNHLASIYRGCSTFPDGRKQCYSSGSLRYTVDGTTNHYAHENYDDSGSVIYDRVHSYAYDAAGSMTSLQGSGRNERFAYTADDERIAIVDLVANKTTWTLRDLQHRLLRTFTRTNVSGNTGWSWAEDEIWRGSLLLASESPSGRKHYHLDHLGSPRLITNTAGAPVGEQAFLPFGEGGTTDGGRLQFTGHERDNIPAHGSGVGRALDYMHARYYSASMGRFLSVDPTWESADLAKPQTWNRYAYVMNNPVNLTDPDGKCPFCVRLLWELATDFVTDGSPAGSSADLPKDPVERAAYLQQHKGSGTVTRYMTEGEARIARETGNIPNVGRDGKQRPTHVTTDKPTNNATTAQRRYEIDKPTHRATVPIDRVPGGLGPAPDGRATTSGGGSQAATNRPIPVKPSEIKPLDQSVWRKIVNWFL